MPKVGNKHFSYSNKGIKAAKMLAKKTGKKITKMKGK